MLSCDVIIWDDTPLFIFPENFTHSGKGHLEEIEANGINWYLLVVVRPWQEKHIAPD
jgi:hypothetical protein